MLSILIGISSNFDNLGIGLSIGVRQVRIPWVFCSLNALTSFAACLLGSATALRIGHVISASDSNLLASFILICVGLWTMIQTFLAKTEESIPGSIGFSEAMFIALAQGLTDLSIGFGAGFAKLNVGMTAACVGGFSFLLLLLPIGLGIRWIPGGWNTGAAFLSGILLIAVALFL